MTYLLICVALYCLIQGAVFAIWPVFPEDRRFGLGGIVLGILIIGACIPW